MVPSILAQSESSSYMPHGMCYLWQEDLVWIHVVSDGLTTLAYWAIPPFLLYLALKAREEFPSSAPYARKRLPYDWMLVAFGVFIVACGATHAMGIWTIWEPRYWLEGGIKAVTAVASVATAIALPPLVPRALEVLREARESEIRRVELEEANEEQRELVRQLKEASAARSRFLAGVSHDLRTPLSLILGPVDEILADDPPPEVREQLQAVARNARTLRSQVENLLSVARSEEAGRVTVDAAPVDLGSLLGEVADHYGDHARGREIDFSVDAGPGLSVRADRELMKRSLLNLLSNAFKFTPDGGRIRLVVRSHGDGGVAIEVRDSGPGVPPSERDAVFERFRQGESGTAAGAGGTGLGLAIVQEVIRAHDGTVKLDEAPEGGARFTVRLPATRRIGEETQAPAGATPDVGEEPDAADGSASTTAPEEIRHPAREPGSDPESEEWRAAAASDRATVLVVEDNADMARYLGGQLSGDFRVAYAADGEEGLERARALGPDLIVTDLMMPAMDGADLISALRERPELEDIPVLVLTARAEEGLAERMLRRGAHDYLLKPVRPEELRARVENLVELAGSRRVLQESLDSAEESLQSLARLAASRKEELERAVERNRVLMQELHHRVKGNLQTISSLLTLQLRSVDDEQARESLEESRGRVATMGLVHERLYDSGTPDRVELSGYLRRLVADVVRSREATGEVATRLELEEMDVPIDQAVACGLLVHELVVNALRHAFPGDARGTVRVRLRREEQDAILEVSDDGRGMDRSGREPPADSLGIQLVEALAEQLEGQLQFPDRDGTEVAVRFPIAEPREPGAHRTSAGS